MRFHLERREYMYTCTHLCSERTVWRFTVVRVYAGMSQSVSRGKVRPYTTSRRFTVPTYSVADR